MGLRTDQEVRPTADHYFSTPHCSPQPFTPRILTGMYSHSLSLPNTESRG